MFSEHEASLCVFCRKNRRAAKWRPFCSERCKLQDLARWVDGAYRVAAEPVSPTTDPGDDDTNLSEVRRAAPGSAATRH